MQKHLIDNLTGIHNEEYLRINYQKYLDENPDSNFIMIDFEKFKAINDIFGHNIGDDYLKLFARILNDSFKNSISVRLHGDEFAILTKYSEDRIEKIFDLCDQKILLAELEGKIPKKFKYNAGSSKAEHGINNTKEKSDYMMYYAKRNNLRYQKFSPLVLEEKEKSDGYLKTIDTFLNEDSFSYKTRQLFNGESIPQNVFQIYTKSSDGSSIFDNNRYEILKKSSKLLQFDIYNVQRLIEKIGFEDRKMMINIDFKSLINAPNILEYLKVFKEISLISFDNIILSIDINGLEENQMQNLINSIQILKTLGFLIRLEKLSNMIGDKIWEEADVNYIKISNEYWKNADKNFKSTLSLENKVATYEKCNIVPIFEFIEEEKEMEFLKKITPDNTLFSGNYFSDEKKLVLK
ncbi:MAG: GGDEF domain-containing protein [Bacilli bacterium]